MASKKRILQEILPVHLIREVEKWPVLYKRDCPEVPNTHFRNKVWNEVAKALIQDWESYSAAEKECKILELTKKWRNLRDTFKRQILVDKKRLQGHHIKKKNYVYFKHMSFLLPHMEDAEVGVRAPEPATAPRPKRRRAERTLPSPEHIDEDQHFLMSLLPSFRRMSDDEKLTAKMEILKVIKEVRSQAAAVFRLTDDPPLAAVKNELFEDESFRSECSGHSGVGDFDDDTD